MIKRTVSVFLVIMVFLSAYPVFAGSADATVYNISLNDAVKMATEGSAEMNLCDINSQNMKKALNEAQITRNDLKDVAIHMNQNFELIYAKNGYYVNMYRKYIELADDEKKKTEASIAYDTTQKYFTYKNAIVLLDAAKNGLERAKSNLEIITQKFELGICTQLEVTNAQIAVDECEANVSKSQFNAELCMESLKIRLNISGDCVLNLTDNIAVEPYTSNVDNDIKNALSTRYDVKALKVSEELAKDYFDTTSILSQSSSLYYSAYADYVRSKQNYDNGVKNIALGIKSAYYDVINAQNASRIAQQKLEFAKKQYEVSKLQFEMGMITNIVLSSISDELTMAEINYTNSLLGEKLAVENYKYQITIGI